MGHLLGRIVDATWDPERKLMLSALVHYLSQNDPGPGFYALAADRGLLPRAASADAKFEFWITQMNKLFEVHTRPTRSR